MEDTAIVILNYNSADDVVRCVESLKGVPSANFVVVDNASRSEDRDQLRAFCSAHGITLLESDHNRGYNAGNNIGLKYAVSKGFKYLLLANPDMIFTDAPTYIEALKRAMVNDPDIVAVGSDILTPEGVHQNPRNGKGGKWWQSFKWVVEFLSIRGHGDSPEWIDCPEQSRTCDYLNGCCLMLSSDFLEQIGYFDERTFLYGEEPILGRQVQIAGKKMYYQAEVSAVHNHRKSREGASSFCRAHWKHSRMLYARYYSGYPWYGRWFTYLSLHLYFAALGISDKIKG